MSVFYNDDAFRDADIPEPESNCGNGSDDWTLTQEQMAFMLSYDVTIKLAYTLDDMMTLRQIEASDEYGELFGDMSWDEAFDRYECMLENDKDA